MEKTLMVYTLLFGITLAVLVFYATNADESRSRRLAKIRVRVDSSQRGEIREPRDDEFEDPRAVKWLSVGVALLLLFLLLSQA